MKTRLVQFIMICGTLLPLTQAQAGGPSGKTIGGLSAGKKFTLTVQSLTSSQSVGTRNKLFVPIPSEIPKFKKGQAVKFTIGTKGQLVGPGFSIPLLSTSASINSYAKLPNLSSLSPNGAGVYKNTAGKPVGSTLIFYKYRIDGATVNGLTINQVSYTLN